VFERHNISLAPCNASCKTTPAELLGWGPRSLRCALNAIHQSQTNSLRYELGPAIQRNKLNKTIISAAPYRT